MSAPLLAWMVVARFPSKQWRNRIHSALLRDVTSDLIYSIETGGESSKCQLMSLLPKSGTLQYPATQLVALARLILTQYESHLKVEFDAYNESNDDDATCDAGLILDDIHMLNYLVNLPRYVEMEELRRGEKMNPVDYHGIDYPKQPERALLNVGIQRKANYLFVDAVKLRKETRREPSSGGNWDSEDALLDFLVFLSQPKHKDLFDVGT